MTESTGERLNQSSTSRLRIMARAGSLLGERTLTSPNASASRHASRLLQLVGSQLSAPPPPDEPPPLQTEHPDEPQRYTDPTVPASTSEPESSPDFPPGIAA